MTKRTFLAAKDAKHLRAFLDDSTFANASKLAEAFSVSTSTMSAWLNGKSPTPKWTLLAAEGLRRRRRAEATDAFLLYLPKNKPDAATVMRQVAASFGGILSQPVSSRKED